MPSFTAAVCNYNIHFYDRWVDVSENIQSWVSTAVKKGASFLVFPEYGSMELTSLLDNSLNKDISRQLAEIQTYYDEFLLLFKQLAIHYQICILAPSFPVRQPCGNYYNRASLFGADGLLGYQDKIMMTRFEDEQWCISGATSLNLIPMPIGNVGICICYDSEFPLLARKLVDQGAHIILAPSCTDSPTGFNRVRIGARARALENQCYVLHACTVGNASWSPAVSVNYGLASIYSPVDKGFPEDGIIAQAQSSTPNWVYGCLDTDKLRHVRESGQVFNHRDWDQQHPITLKEIK